MLKSSRRYSKIVVSSGKRGPYIVLSKLGFCIPETVERSAVLFYLDTFEVRILRAGIFPHRNKI